MNKYKEDDDSIFGRKEFFDNECFLCGEVLNDDNNTDEHVYPKWLLRKFNLWDKELTLLNNTKIPYRNLKIPCCVKCNNEHLSNMERKVQKAFDSGYEGVSKLDKSVLFKWFIKLSYGVLYKERTLLHNRKNINDGTIISNEDLASETVMNIFLQSIRYEAKFSSPKPFSIMLFKLWCDDKEDIYDAGDLINNRFFYMRQNDVGIIMCFGDDGVNKQMLDDYYSFFYDKTIHPFQFYELVSRVFYKQHLLFSKPLYHFSLPANQEDILSIDSLSGADKVFNKWDQKKYFSILKFFINRWNTSVLIEFHEPDLVSSSLQNQNLDWIKYNGIEIDNFEFITRNM